MVRLAGAARNQPGLTLGIDVSYGTPPPPPGQPPYGQQPYGQPQFGGPASGDPGTLDLPWYGIGFADAVKRAFQKYARFDGRASRGEYWWFALGLFVIYIVLYIPLAIGTAAESTALTLIFGLLVLVFALAIIVPSIAVGVRRLHDAGFSGWLYLLAFVPCVSIVVLVLMALPSKPEGAKYDRVSGGGASGGYGY